MFDYAGDLVRNPNIFNKPSVFLDDEHYLRLDEIKRTENPHKYWKTIPVKLSPSSLCICDEPSS
jgi:hypothetical protein